MPVLSSYKFVSREFHPDDSEIQIKKGVSIGGKKVAVIAGPCSIEDYDSLLDVAKKVKAAGATILYGTDAAVLPHDMGGWQFAIMVERGMAPMDAIRSATSVAADHMGMAADVGALEQGRFGDLIAVRGNPLEDMLVMRDVPVVIKGGLVFKQP